MSLVNMLAHVGDAVALLGHAVDAEAEGEAAPLLGVDPARRAARWGGPCRSRRARATCAVRGARMSNSADGSVNGKYDGRSRDVKPAPKNALVNASMVPARSAEGDAAITAGNCVVVCSIENLDPMGVHTGDSWTVAPQQTLPDAEYQRLREAAFTCARAVGVATGGANVQFAYDPETRELRVIEMNPRVSRSSALASKATGFPIAKLAALLAIGYTLDELPNDITQQTTAAFEPALDYVAVKAPRFDFEKFPGADDRLGSEMRAVGESLGLGRTFPEAFLKALRRPRDRDDDELISRGAASRSPSAGISCSRPRGRGSTSRASIRTSPTSCARSRPPSGCRLREAARFGVIKADAARGAALPGRLAVDSCAAEFEAQTPYFYLSYEPSDDGAAADGERSRRPRLRPEPHRPGDRVRLLLRPRGETFRALGYEAVLVNPNPETVSTDYDTSDRLYLEPLTLERTLDVCELEQPLGVVVSFGGQTPLRLAPGLADAGVPLLGDPLAAIDAAEDRVRFAAAARRARPERAAVARGRRRGGGARGRRGARLPGARAAAPRDRRTGNPRRAQRRPSSTSQARASSTGSSTTRSSSTSTSSATARMPGSRRSSSTSSGRAATRATPRSSSRRRA